MDDLGARLRLRHARHPRHARIDHDHEIGLREMRVRVRAVAEIHLVIARQVHVGGVDLQHRDRLRAAKALSAATASAERPSAEVMISGYSAFAISCAASSITLSDGAGAATPSGRTVVAPHRHGIVRQHLARQAEIDRAARLAHRDVERAVDQRADRLARAQLVIPFDELAHHAALVERFLAPVDRAVARGDVAGLGDRRAAGAQQHRHVVARHVHELADGVGGADGDVQHHRRRLAGDAVVAVGHGHREIFVRHGDEARVLAPPLFRDTASMIGAKSVPALAKT